LLHPSAGEAAVPGVLGASIAGVAGLADCEVRAVSRWGAVIGVDGRAPDAMFVIHNHTRKTMIVASDL